MKRRSFFGTCLAFLFGGKVIAAVEQDELVDYNAIRRLPLQGGRLAEDHPGRGVVFDIFLGKWDKDLNDWVYDTETTVKAIDWRQHESLIGTYPDTGAMGLFIQSKNAANEQVYQAVTLDCATPTPREARA